MLCPSEETVFPPIQPEALVRLNGGMYGKHKSQRRNLDARELRLLIRAGRGRLPGGITRDDSELNTYVDLVDTGYLDGCIVLDGDGKPVKVTGAHITPSGEEYLEQFGENFETNPDAIRIQTFKLVIGFAYSFVLIAALLTVCKSNDNFVFGHEEASAPLLPPKKAIPEASPSGETVFFGVCGMPPVE